MHIIGHALPAGSLRTSALVSPKANASGRFVLDCRMTTFVTREGLRAMVIYQVSFADVHVFLNPHHSVSRSLIPASTISESSLIGSVCLPLSINTLLAPICDGHCMEL